jgi:hypothetical protein
LASHHNKLMVLAALVGGPAILSQGLGAQYVELFKQ